jgi:RimK family alpha-L-glutamate ligase
MRSEEKRPHRALGHRNRVSEPELVIAGHVTPTNELLLGAFHERGVRARVVEPGALGQFALDLEGDRVILGRVDVRRTLDGVEDGIWDLRAAERRGARVLNPASALIACHDKLETALRLAASSVPHPTTSLVGPSTRLVSVEFPVVVKPRFGSWGRDVVLCESPREYRRYLRRIRKRPWFRRHGALVQPLIPPLGFDLRIVVARGQVVGAIERVAAPGEWRTNVALGGSRRPVSPPQAACELAVAAATAVGTDLVGVDLLPLGDGSHIVLELNGAADFTAEYSLVGGEIFDRVVALLAGPPIPFSAERPGYGEDEIAFEPDLPGP